MKDQFENDDIGNIVSFLREIGLVWFGLVWFGLVWFGLVWWHIIKRQFFFIHIY